MLKAKQHDSDAARVTWNLTNHTPALERIGAIEEMRAYAKRFGYVITEQCPDSREKSLALTALEEAVMWGVASIVRAEDAPE